MNKKIYQVCLSAFFYWLVASFSGNVLVMPDKIVSLAVFIPPMLGLMWGVPAAVGVYVGALLALPELNNFFPAEVRLFNLFFYLIKNFWIFLAGYLPYVLWHEILIDSEDNLFSLSTQTLKKFIIIFFVTFAATSIFRTLTATSEELSAVNGLIGSGKSLTLLTYAAACFINDFFIAIFFDLAWLFFLVRIGFKFHNSAINLKELLADMKNGIYRAWVIELGFYILFPITLFYVEKYQIYGMNHLATWLEFVAECLTVIDIYLVMMVYLLLCYRRSIMLEIVFLVSQTVFFTASVLGWGSSVALGNLVNNHTEESLRAMSVICRERLYRTFFCVRQAVNGMKLQAVNSIESYEQLANDVDYRENYLAQMKNNFRFIAVGIDGSISYYLRLKPEIAGTKGGFSMQREEARWEGALSPFVEREPIDLAPYDPDDAQNVGWYYIPMESKSATWIEPYVDAVTHFYVISYVAPLFLDDEFIGVVGMDIDFNFIVQELRRMSIYDYGYVYIMDRNNKVLYHRDQPQGEQFQPNPEFQEIDVYLMNGMWLGIATPLSKVYDDRNRILMHLIAAIIIVAMVISVGSIALASKAIKPLAGMTEAAKRIASGDLNVKISYESGNELGILVRSIREMAAKLEVYVYRDKLTGLRNAAAYIAKSSELDEQIKTNPALNFGVVIFDANFLKKINDNYGHDAGNELIRHAAQVICKVFENSPVYRIGGDEFAAILESSDYENRQELLQLFDKKIAEENFQMAGDIINVSVARGLGIYERGMNFADVAKKADVAMYNHKSAIKSKFGEEVR
ncbi:MAG: diguanylate cyclase [Selenomonadaceae bacterium]|nr:diguanylate cyclase [Selenomonadaceae bacterium]